MRRYWLAIATLVALAVSLSAQTPAARRTVAIKAGRLLDVATREVRTGAVIIVEGDRIRAIESAVPAGAEVIDLSEYTVAPGFIDAHTHALLQGDATAAEYDGQLLKESMPFRALRATRALRIALDHGFTTMRDIGNEGAGFADVDLKQAIERGIIQGPRLFVATKALAPTGAYGLSGYAWELDVPRGVQMCDGADGCRQAVRDQINHGADWIKVYADRSYYADADGAIRSLPNFTVDEMRAIVDQAHRTRRKVAAHSMTPTGHGIALGAGVDSIEHGDVLDEKSIKTMVERGVYWCPTLTVGDFVDGPRSVTNPIWSVAPRRIARIVSKGVQGGREDRHRYRCRRVRLGQEQPGGGVSPLHRARHVNVGCAARGDHRPGRDARPGGHSRDDRARCPCGSRRDARRSAV